jgi:hypothetical protein
MEQVQVLFFRGTIKMAAHPVCIRLQPTVNFGRLVEQQSQWPTKLYEVTTNFRQIKQSWKRKPITHLTSCTVHNYLHIWQLVVGTQVHVKNSVWVCLMLSISEVSEEHFITFW